MAIHKLNQGSGTAGAKTVGSVPERSGETHTTVVTHTVKEAIPSGGILEIGVIPAGCRLVGFKINTENIPAGDLTAGLITGEFYADDDDRTLGKEIVDAEAAGTEYSASLLDLVEIPRSDKNVGIGISHSVNIPATQVRKIHVIYQIAG